MKLRKRMPVCYFELEESSFDEYIYCDKCVDFVYEYCSIHGPLLIIPDDKVPVPSKLRGTDVPRSALTIPQTFLHLAPSTIPGAGLGVFSSLTLPRGVRFGPYCGARSRQVTSMYCWQIHFENNKPSHVVDASDPNASNWMRYVNCARRWHEQNLVAYQYRGQIYYRTIKMVPQFTELMVYYGSEAAMALGVDMRQYNIEEYHEIIHEQALQASDHTANHEGNTLSPAPEIPLLFDENLPNEDATIDEIDPPSIFYDDVQDCTEEETIICYNGSKENISIENITILDDKEECFDTEFDQVTTTEDTSMKYNEDASTCDIFTVKPRVHSCQICTKTFDKLYSLKRHYLTHKVDNNKVNFGNFKVNNCKVDLGFDSNCKFNGYNVDNCKLNDNTADNCQVNGCQAANCKVDDYQVDNGKDNNCKVAGIRTKMFVDLTNICDVCGYPCESKNNLIRHKSRKHSIKTCPVCKRQFSDKTYLTRHMMRHIEIKKYNCNKCDFKTNFIHILNQHLRGHMSEKVYKCDTCIYSTYRRACIIRHVKIHNKNIPYIFGKLQKSI